VNATSITRKQDEATGTEIAQLRAEVATLKQALLGELPAEDRQLLEDVATVVSHVADQLARLDDALQERLRSYTAVRPRLEIVADTKQGA
jgi:hypothetical protein